MQGFVEENYIRRPITANHLIVIYAQHAQHLNRKTLLENTRAIFHSRILLENDLISNEKKKLREKYERI